MWRGAFMALCLLSGVGNGVRFIDVSAALFS